MFRKLIILLGLLVAPAFGQEMTYTDPTQIPIADQTYTVIQQQTPTPIEEIKNTGGTALTLYDDGVSQVIGLGFDFYFFGNLYDSVYISQNGFISFTSQANGCCGGMPLPSFTEWNEQSASYFQYINVNNSIFAMWSDLADFNAPGNPYYKSTGNSFVAGWYGVDELGTANKFTFEISLFSDNSFSINYGGFDYAGVTGRTFTSGYQGDQAGEYYQIFNGTNPSSLQNTTYFVQSSEVTPPPPPPPEDPIAPDCTINPYDPTCVINDLTDTTDEPTYLADEETGSDDGSDDGSEYIEEEEEELLADEDISDDESLEELLDEEQLVADEETSDEQLEELLADIEEDSESFTEPAVVATYRELSDEEKAAILADAISKTTLESALSIAAETTTNSSTTASNTESTVSSTSTRSSNESSSSTTAVSEESTLSADNSSQQNEETAASDDALDILETGRQLGQQALSETLAASENASNESLAEAESIASSSSEASASQQSVVAVNDTQSTDVNLSASEQQIIETQTVAVTQEDTTQLESVMADTSAETLIDMGMPTDTNTIDSTSQIVEEANMLAESLVRGPVAELIETDEALAVVEASRATSEQKAFDDDTNKDAEVTTAMVDPALAMANTFNQAPSMMSLEFLGIVKPVEEKSDAEIRAEQVVAANKEEQDKINSNYMDADQSGIVAAIAVDADVSSYLSARLADNNTWYKPEDIYKGVKINDNVRGSYFLEKGNTDTYKKMIEEQYK